LITDDRLIIINDGAQNIAKHIKGAVDGIVSSIPITIFPEDLRESILKESYAALKKGAFYSQILYTKRGKLFKPHFGEVQINRLINIPLEYIHHCKKL